MKAGFGRSDITPRLGVQLAGYGPYRNRAGRAVLAPLSARAMAVSSGRSRAVLISLELCGTSRLLAERIRQAVSARVGLRPAEVLVGATHTHSGPATGGMFGWGEADGLYVETLPARVADAAEAAWKARTEVVWSHGEAPCEGIAVNRETDAGFAWSADFKERMNPAWRPVRPQDTDPVARVLCAREPGGRLIGLLHHFGCHPVVCGEKTTDIHGDFVGLASIRLETAHPGAVALFFPGALGDINPKINHRNPAESRIALRAIARAYAAAAERAIRAARPVEDGGVLRVVARDAVLRRIAPSPGQLAARIRRLEKLFTPPGCTDDPVAGGAGFRARGMEMARLEGLRSILADFRGRKAPNEPVRVSGLRIGPFAFVGAGIELYNALRTATLKGSPHAHTWIVSLIAGQGYAHDAAAQRRLGYTNDFVPIMKGTLPFVRVYSELPSALSRLAADLAR